MNFNSVRMPRRMTVAVSGMVAAATLVAGAGSASAGPVISMPNPTTAVCNATQCKVHDSDGIVHVGRSDGDVTQHTGYGGQKDVPVAIEGIISFTVTDKRGINTTFNLVSPG